MDPKEVPHFSKLWNVRINKDIFEQWGEIINNFLRIQWLETSIIHRTWNWGLIANGIQIGPEFRRTNCQIGFRLSDVIGPCNCHFSFDFSAGLFIWCEKLSITWRSKFEQTLMLSYFLSLAIICPENQYEFLFNTTSRERILRMFCIKCCRTHYTALTSSYPGIAFASKKWLETWNLVRRLLLCSNERGLVGIS